MPAPSRSICAGTFPASRPSSCRTCPAPAAWSSPTGLFNVAPEGRHCASACSSAASRSIRISARRARSSCRPISTGSAASIRRPASPSMWHTAKVKTIRGCVHEDRGARRQRAERQRDLSVADEQHHRHQVQDRLAATSRTTKCCWRWSAARSKASRGSWASMKAQPAAMAARQAGQCHRPGRAHQASRSARRADDLGLRQGARAPHDVARDDRDRRRWGGRWRRRPACRPNRSKSCARHLRRP